MMNMDLHSSANYVAYEHTAFQHRHNLLATNMLVSNLLGETHLEFPY